MNSSYLNEILNAEGNDLVNIIATVSKLVNYANLLKKDVTTVVENQSLRFNPMLKENMRLKCQGEELLKEMHAVEEKIEKEIKEELAGCTVELEELSYSLKEVNLFLHLLTQLLDINSVLIKAKKKMGIQEFYESAQLVKSLQETVKKKHTKFENVEVFKVLSQEVTLTYELLIHTISEVWSSNVMFGNVDGNTTETKDVTQISLSINTRACSELTQVLKASNYLNSHLNEKKFSKMLLTDILSPMIINESEVIVNTENGSAILLLRFLKNEKKPNYLDVFENITKTIKFLKSHLNIEIEKEKTFMSLVGSYIATDFADILIKSYLSEAIPSNSNDFNNYKKIVEDAAEFEKCLQSIDFLPKDSYSLMEYARNINALFANKFCQSFLNKAKTIMKKDLHNITMSEEIVSIVNVLPPPYKGILKNKINIQEDVFKFSKCQISKHAKEIIDLLHSMMSEIEKSMELCAVRLFYTIRNIFEMYCAVVPLHHKKFLESLPQQVALFHNNCLYFAHNLIHVITEFNGKIPSVLKSHFHVLLEQAVCLRALAAEKLESSVTNQRNQLIYILRDSGFAALQQRFSNNENPQLDPNSEKSLRQCIRQLQILQKVWSDVLPLNVYNRAIGFLIDAIIEELVTLIISVEDITSQTASDLVSSFTMLSEKIPNLFDEEKEIYRHVRKWQKFKEFILVLQGTLRDIDDRWANGMGPLAVEFTAEQVKHLIRALFQNSDKRAALLTRIR